MGSMDVRGKVCIIAGSAQGLGRAFAIRLLEGGGKEEQFVNLFDKTEEFFKVSCVDLLANNAGVNLNFGWRKCMEINIISVMLGTDIALERMRKAGKSGQIINTASMAGFAPGLSEKMTAYTVSKHGVVALTRTMGKTTAGVAHKCICPSWANTE